MNSKRENKGNSSPSLSKGDTADLFNAGTKTGIGKQKLKQMFHQNKASNYGSTMNVSDLTNPKGYHTNVARNAGLAAKDLGKLSKGIGFFSGFNAFNEQMQNSKAQTNLGRYISSAFAGAFSYKVNPFVSIADMATGKRLSSTVTDIFDKGVVQSEKLVKRMGEMEISDKTLKRISKVGSPFE